MKHHQREQMGKQELIAKPAGKEEIVIWIQVALNRPDNQVTTVSRFPLTNSCQKVKN